MAGAEYGTAAQVGALRRIKKVATGSVGLMSTGRIPKRQEQPSSVAGHPVERQAPHAHRKGHADPANALERHSGATAGTYINTVRLLRGADPDNGRSDRQLEAQRRIVGEVQRREAG